MDYLCKRCKKTPVRHSFMLCQECRNNRICNMCGKSEKEVQFTKEPTLNRCQACHLLWRERDRENRGIRIYSQTKKIKQQSPENFIRYLCYRKAYYARRNEKKRSSAATLIWKITVNDVIDLYHRQKGKCALLKIPMTCELKNPRTISIDRIDSSKGYLIDNIQLVCNCMNLAKNTYSNESIKAVIKEAIEVRG